MGSAAPSPSNFVQTYQTIAAPSKPAAKRQRKMAKKSTGISPQLQQVARMSSNFPGGLNRGANANNSVTNAMLTLVDNDINAMQRQPGQQSSPMNGFTNNSSPTASINQSPMQAQMNNFTPNGFNALNNNMNQTTSPMSTSPAGMINQVASTNTFGAVSGNFNQMSIEQQIQMHQLQAQQLQQQLQNQQLLQQLHAQQTEIAQLRVQQQTPQGINANATTDGSPQAQFGVSMQANAHHLNQQQSPQRQNSPQTATATGSPHQQPFHQGAVQNATAIGNVDPQFNTAQSDLTSQQQMAAQNQSVGLGISGVHNNSNSTIDLTDDSSYFPVSNPSIAPASTYEAFLQERRSSGKAAKASSSGQMRYSPYGNAAQRQVFAQNANASRVHQQGSAAAGARLTSAPQGNVDHQSPASLNNDTFASSNSPIGGVSNGDYSSATVDDSTFPASDSPVPRRDGGKANTFVESSAPKMIPLDFFTPLHERELAKKAAENEAAVSKIANNVTAAGSASPERSNVLQQSAQPVQQRELKINRPGQYNDRYGHYTLDKLGMPGFSDHVHTLIMKAVGIAQDLKMQGKIPVPRKDGKQDFGWSVGNEAYGEEMVVLGCKTIALNPKHYQFIFDRHIESRKVCTAPERPDSVADRHLVEAIRRNSPVFPIPEADIIAQFNLMVESEHAITQEPKENRETEKVQETANFAAATSSDDAMEEFFDFNAYELPAHVPPIDWNAARSTTANGNASEESPEKEDFYNDMLRGLGKYVADKTFLNGLSNFAGFGLDKIVQEAAGGLISAQKEKGGSVETGHNVNHEAGDSTNVDALGDGKQAGDETINFNDDDLGSLFEERMDENNTNVNDDDLGSLFEERVDENNTDEDDEDKELRRLLEIELAKDITNDDEEEEESLQTSELEEVRSVFDADWQYKLVCVEGCQTYQCYGKCRKTGSPPRQLRAYFGNRPRDF